jgi:hypothetical protein
MTNHYPTLFYPDEEIVGPLGNPDDGYFLLSKDVLGGVFFIVIQLDKKEGRRKIIEVGSRSYEMARNKAIEAYEKDWNERCGSKEVLSSDSLSSLWDSSSPPPIS